MAVDGTRFDELSQRWSRAISRRRAVPAIALGLALLGEQRAADAKGHKKHRKHKKRCKAEFASCTDNATCCNGNCCTFLNPFDQFCLDPAVFSCPVDQRCCVDTQNLGYCCDATETCCTRDPSGCCAT